MDPCAPFAIGRFYVETDAPTGAAVRSLVVAGFGPDALGLDRVTFRRPDGREFAVWAEQAAAAVAVGHLVAVPSAFRRGGLAA